MRGDDPLGHKISVTDELAKRGIKGSPNKRAVAAINRLLGDAVDFLNRPVDDQNDDRWEKSEPILAAHHHEIFAKYKNRQAVVEHALEELEQIARAENRQTTNDSISDDWLNFFSAYAEKAASGNLRQTFGRILSGEIQRPGSFSLSTLRIVSELDADSASLFQRVASRAFSLDVKDPTPSAVLKPEDLRGQYLHKMLKLEALGLIQEVGGDFAISTSNAEAGALILIRFGRLLLRGTVKTKAYFSLPLLKLTDSGAELCSIIAMDHRGGAREVGGILARRGLEASIHVITGIGKGDVHYRSAGEAVRA